MSDWRSMDSAPKTGEDILVYIGEPPNGQQMVVFYDEPDADAPNHCWHRADGLAYHRDAPTFWQWLQPDPTPPLKPKSR